MKWRVNSKALSLSFLVLFRACGLEAHFFYSNVINRQALSSNPSNPPKSNLLQRLNIPTQPIQRLSKRHAIHPHRPPNRQGRKNRREHRQNDPHLWARQQHLHGLATAG